ncbi:hypothetical protein IFU01_15370 [Oxalobacteraceae sp. CFBP 8763]|nr:hypothetical protein [Oxalobacteraceae sp. CFBP 8761]MBD8565639.1 hypothetical protein [Oxalobacteraceae sp. CFBP 8763]
MQKSFSDLEYANKKKLTRRDRFLAEIDKATPWVKLHQEIGFRRVFDQQQNFPRPGLHRSN